MYDLGSFNDSLPWDTIFFEVATEAIKPGALSVKVNGIKLEIGKNFQSNTAFTPVVIAFDQRTGIVAATVANTVLDKATVLDPQFASHMSITFHYFFGTTDAKCGYVNFWVAAGLAIY